MFMTFNCFIDFFKLKLTKKKNLTEVIRKYHPDSSVFRNFKPEVFIHFFFPAWNYCHI